MVGLARVGTGEHEANAEAGAQSSAADRSGFEAAPVTVQRAEQVVRDGATLRGVGFFTQHASLRGQLRQETRPHYASLKYGYEHL